uniref:Conserved oligomeric Golgi complex subunit 3 n=1 Tax=Enterobius vermicularis TaxID=51028 RepID=A0A0N4UXM4_ENTVE
MESFMSLRKETTDLLAKKTANYALPDDEQPVYHSTFTSISVLFRDSCASTSHRKMMNLSFLSASKWKTRKQLKLSSFLHSNLKIRKLRNPVNEAFLLCNSKLLSKFCLNYLKKSNYAEQKLTSRIHREIPVTLETSDPEGGVSINKSEGLEERDYAADELFSCISEIYENEKENVMAGIYAENEEVTALQKCTDHMRLLTERHDNAMKTLNELRNAYEMVTERTSSLHNACDQMMAHQTHLAAGAEQIRANLYYFTQHDAIMKKLNTGKLSVNGKSFMQLLATIDECLSFLRDHIQYKDSLLYIEKYNQCLSKAMTAIRVAVLSDLEASVNAVRDRQAQLDADAGQYSYPDEDTFALIYGVFAGRANFIRSALSAAEQRFADVPEYQAMAADCQNAYFSIRKQLLSPILHKTIEQLLQKHAESSCALTRNGCSFLLRLCDDEFRLFKQFFNQCIPASENKSPHSQGNSVPSSPLSKAVLAPFVGTQTCFDDFIESISRIFYDVLRPIVVHNPHLETLAELCTILKVEMIEERCGLMLSVMQQMHNIEALKSSGKGDSGEEILMNPRNGFVRVMGELVGDIAERIVYRWGSHVRRECGSRLKSIQETIETLSASFAMLMDCNRWSQIERFALPIAGLYGQSDILGFRPSPGDLAYPEKLIMMKKIELESAAAKEAPDKTSDSSNNEPTPAVDLHCLWYPTVRRTVLCLSKLYRCLDLAVFQSIARELLSVCCDSLTQAAEQIQRNVAQKSSKLRGMLDSELFVVKHLLILREQTSPYRAVLSEFSSTTDLIPQRDYSLDLSKYKTSASHLLQNRQRWFELNSNNAFLELLFQVPVSVIESSGDSRRIIDSQLKTHCHSLIKVATDLIVLNLSNYILKVESQQNTDTQPSEKSEPLVEPSVMQDLSAQAFKNLTRFWPEIKDAFDLYIGAKDAEDILLQAVRKQVSDFIRKKQQLQRDFASFCFYGMVFSRANSFAEKHYDDEQRQIAGIPTQEQVALVRRVRCNILYSTVWHEIRREERHLCIVGNSGYSAVLDAPKSIRH